MTDTTTATVTPPSTDETAAAIRHLARALSQVKNVKAFTTLCAHIEYTFDLLERLATADPTTDAADCAHCGRSIELGPDLYTLTHTPNCPWAETRRLLGSSAYTNNGIIHYVHLTARTPA